jgi:hypothetical protein
MLSIFLSGCAGHCLPDIFQPFSMGQQALAAGLRQYDDGDYADSARNLQLAIKRGLTRQERVKAHKHLAFINCASERERQCRQEFRNALALDPAMELAATEAGHPVWGPVFRSLKRTTQAGAADHMKRASQRAGGAEYVYR